MHTTIMGKRRLGISKLIVSGLMALSCLFLTATPASAAACTAPSTDYGTATTTLSISSAATYRIWTRVLAPDTTNNTYLLEVDGNTCFNVGGGTSVTPNTWTWVDWYNSNTTTKVQMSLSQGNHTLKLIGNTPNLAIDRIVATSDLTCPVRDLGDNCKDVADTTAPVVSISAPASGATVGGTVSVQATASDNQAVSKVEFYDNSVLISTSTTTPYTTSWNTANLPNGNRTLAAKAYDAAGNVGVATVGVTVQNGDQSTPTAPSNVKATATSYNKVHLTWTASTDNVGVTGYLIKRNGAVLQQVGNITAFDDTMVNPTTAYSYTLTAFDAAGNQSAASADVTVTTPAAPVTDTTPPTAPADLTGATVNSSQVNLGWTASTDTVGVTGYDIYRRQSGKTDVKIATVTSTSFGDTGLKPNTAYEYHVTARDAAGNVSTDSNHVTVTTPRNRKTVIVHGTVSDTSNIPLRSANVTLKLDSHKLIYTTGRNGKYGIKIGTGGTYDLTYSARNYTAQSQKVQIADGSTITRDVTLTKK
jgi:chitodextrinase